MFSGKLNCCTMTALKGAFSMGRRVGWFGVFLALWFLGFGLVPAFGGESQWVEVKSPHFSVVTDGGDKRGREVAVRFEQMRAVFGALMVKANVNLAVPLQIVAFRNTKELRQFAPLWKGKPTQVAGLFQGSNDRCFILLDLSVENPWQVVFHEYGHQLMNGNIAAPIAPWFEEGFAEYFRSIEVDGKEAHVGKVPDDTYQVLQQTGTMKVVDLFRVQQNSSTYNESGDPRGTFYAESSMVVHYLYDHGLIPKLSTYFNLTIDQRVSVEDAIQRSFGMSAAQFDKEIRNYISSGRYRYYKLPTPEGIVTKNYAVTALSAADGNAILADVHLHSQDYRDKAAEEFEAILKTDPANTAALRGLGYSHLMKQDYDKAGECFQKAAQGNSKDPRVHYYAGMLMSREGTLGDPDKVAEMTKELETAVALDPSFADAYSLLGFAYAAQGKPEKGVEAAQKAVAMSPRNDAYVFNLAQMYLNNRKPADAIVLLQSVKNSPQQNVAIRAQQVLEEAQMMKGMMDSGQPVVIRTGEVRVEAEHPADSQAQGEEAAKVEVKTLPAQSAPKFGKGKLESVDCTATPGATLNVTVSGKLLKLHVSNTKRVLVMGADSFSCAWSGQKVAVNYRETADGAGELVSIELQ
jgi:tetratricopeptide (TPR) repeat protein